MIEEERMGSQNPLISKICIPGETFRLPSNGIFYNNGELDPDVVDGEIHVYPMKTVDEIVIRSVDKLFSGDGIKEVFERCIPQVRKPLELFNKDVDFLMVALRKVSYGEDFEVLYKHTCDGAKEHTYTIQMSSMIQKTKSIDPTSVRGKFDVLMENGQLVKLHPIRYIDVIALMQDIQTEDDTEDNQFTRSINTLLGIIESVDDITDKDMIREWLTTIPVGWAHKISDAIDATTDWGPDFTQAMVCQDCKETIDLTAPMNPASFFLS